MENRIFAKALSCALAVGLFSSVGCGMIKDTQEMKKTTEEMNDTSRDINVQSHDLAKNTHFLRNDLTAKESCDKVQASLDNLFGRDSDGVDSLNRSESNMLVSAKTTVLAMLNQFWRGEYADLEIASLDERFALHLELVFARSVEHIPRTFAVDPGGLMPPDGAYKAIASLGVFMDLLSVELASTLKSRELPRLSMYDVIVEALRNRGQSERTELLPKSAAMVLRFKREAIYLLQLRHNYLPMVVLGRMTDFQDRNVASRASVLMFGLSQDLGVSEARSSTSVDDEQLKEWIGYLESALQTRQALQEMGIAPEYNSQMMSIVQKVDFGQRQLLASSATNVTPREQLFRDFAKVYTAVATRN